MTENVKLSMVWGGAITAVFCSLIWAIAWYNVAVKRAAMDAGLIQVPYTLTTTETSGAYWSKPGEAEKQP